jgi:hypothetical protein
MEAKENPMKKAILLVGTLLLLCGVSGCSSDSHEAYVKEIISILDDTRRILKGIKDSKNLEDVTARLTKKGEQLQDLRSRVESLKEPLSEDEKKRLDKEYKAKTEKAIQDLADEWDRVKKIPGVEKALGRALASWTVSR